MSIVMLHFIGRDLLVGGMRIYFSEVMAISAKYVARPFALILNDHTAYCLAVYHDAKGKGRAISRLFCSWCYIKINRGCLFLSCTYPSTTSSSSHVGFSKDSSIPAENRHPIASPQATRS